MDLIDRGWTLRDIGRRLRWSDVRTMLRQLPAESHWRRHRSSDKSLVRSTTDQLLTLVVDELTSLRYWMAGSAEQTPEPLMKRLSEADRQDSTPKKPQKRQQTAADARALVAKAFKN